MKQKGTRYILIAFVCLATLLCARHINAQTPDKNQILQTCNQLFVKIAHKKHNLFEVNRFYVLRVTFDERDNLKELFVEPKDYFIESDIEPKRPVDFTYLSASEFENLLSLLDTIKSKGALVKSSEFGQFWKIAVWHTKVYENAILKWGEVGSTQLDDVKQSKVLLFSLTFDKNKAR